MVAITVAEKRIVVILVAGVPASQRSCDSKIMGDSEIMGT
jgi:hypothetical protein